MKPRHKIPKPSEAGMPSVSIFTKIKNSLSSNHSHDSGNSHSHDKSHTHNSEPENATIHTIALVIDGQVFDVMRAQDFLADMLLAQPTFVLVTEDTSEAKINYKYVDGKFIENEPTT